MEETTNGVACFNPGPAKLPKEVLRTVQGSMLNCRGTGLGIMEMSHRSAEFTAINKSAIEKIKLLLSVPDDYKILLMQGGGTGQFSAVPLNLARGENPCADYILTGNWSSKASKEAQKFLKTNEVLPKLDKFVSIPSEATWKLDPQSSYVYYCDNETVHGVEFPFVPNSGKVPLVCDMSSNILTRKVDVSKFGLLFAGAQKNMGCAGVTIVIVREDLIGQSLGHTPVIMDYKETAKLDSLYNTPSTVAVYTFEQCLDWVIRQGGVEEMEKRSAIKSKLIYECIDQSNGFYRSPVEPSVRSRVNVVFRIKDGVQELEEKFVGESKAAGLIGLKGHRSVGGLRASLFNAVSIEDTQKLAQFMKDFQKKYN